MTVPDRILAIDTSGMACSVALWHRGGVAACRRRAMARGHSEALMPMIVDMLGEAGLSLCAIDALAVTVGPGAFTGIRIGLAAARGIGLAAGIPVCGVTTFSAVAEAVPEVVRRGRPLFALLDSKRGDLFVQEFASGSVPVQPPAVLTTDSAVSLLPPVPAIIVGDGVSLLKPLVCGRIADGSLQIHSEGPADARDVACVAARSFASGKNRPPVPLYLRAPDVRIAPTAASGSGSLSDDRGA